MLERILRGATVVALVGVVSVSAVTLFAGLPARDTWKRCGFPACAAGTISNQQVLCRLNMTGPVIRTTFSGCCCGEEDNWENLYSFGRITQRNGGNNNSN